GEDGGGGGLQPMDARRLLVAQLVLVLDEDVVILLQHLLGGLREAALVPVQRGQQENARRSGAKGDDEEKNPGFPACRETVKQCHGQGNSAGFPVRLAELAAGILATPTWKCRPAAGAMPYGT